LVLGEDGSDGKAEKRKGGKEKRSGGETIGAGREGK